MTRGLSDAGSFCRVEAVTIAREFGSRVAALVASMTEDESIPGYEERKQSPEDRERFDDTTKCILCAACTTSCPIYWGNESYVGPAAIVNAHRFIFDSRDEAAADRLDILNQRSGVWRCRTAFSCTEACPRDIKITQAIQEVKRAILYNRI